MGKDNIILFPGLKNRLFRFGLEYLHERKFDEAVQLFEQAKEIDPEYEEVEMALAVAYYESGNYEKAKKATEEMLHKGAGNYHEIIDLYVMVLMQLNLHTEVVHTLEALFEEQHVPPEKEEHYRTLLEFSKRAMERKGTPRTTSETKPDLLFSEGDFREQLLQISSLASKNIQPYKDALIRLLRDDKVHPFLQTAALNVLMEHQIETSVQIRKFDFEGEFIPAKLPDVHEMPFYQEVIVKLNQMLEHENPVLLEQLKEMILRHQFLMYPYEFTPADPMLWAAGYRGFGHEMYGEKWSIEKTAQTFEVNLQDLDYAISFIFNLEQHSPSTV
ncbi:tetratricopeptide repeat protein [Siminovitchia sediminis]|uniref:Tetratricopeptide repeat protein n=1 Tax=Siminovitchia sediminis TaxID=1274353 RepID=A0ABW4KC75_9BACI